MPPKGREVHPSSRMRAHSPFTQRTCFAMPKPCAQAGRGRPPRHAVEWRKSRAQAAIRGRASKQASRRQVLAVARQPRRRRHRGRRPCARATARLSTSRSQSGAESAANARTCAKLEK
eukprot:6206731-Pleurochrysis_carterae.AAC.5